MKLKKRLLKIWENLQQDKKKMYIVLAAAALLAIVDCVYLLSFQMRGTSEARKKVATFRKNIATFKRDFADIENYKKTQAQELARAKKFVNETQKQQLIQEIYDIAAASKVRIEQLKPLLAAKQKDEIVANVRLVPFPMALELVCGYHQLGKFLNMLEEGKYYIAVTEMKIKGNASAPFRHNINLTLVTYAKKG
jgi:Tfp pilus assembly protein PilO